MRSSRTSMGAFIFLITNQNSDHLSGNKTWVWSLENKPMEFRSEGLFFQSSSRRKKKASNDCELHFIDAKLIYFLEKKKKLWLRLDKYQIYFKPSFAYSLKRESFMAWLGDSGLAFLAVEDFCWLRPFLRQETRPARAKTRIIMN